MVQPSSTIGDELSWESDSSKEHLVRCVSVTGKEVKFLLIKKREKCTMGEEVLSSTASAAVIRKFGPKRGTWQSAELWKRQLVHSQSWASSLRKRRRGATPPPRLYPPLPSSSSLHVGIIRSSFVTRNAWLPKVYREVVRSAKQLFPSLYKSYKLAGRSQGASWFSPEERLKMKLHNFPLG